MLRKMIRRTVNFERDVVGEGVFWVCHRVGRSKRLLQFRDMYVLLEAAVVSVVVLLAKVMEMASKWASWGRVKEMVLFLQVRF